MHNNSFQDALLCCHLDFLFNPFSFHLWNPPGSLCWFSPTIVFVIPSQKTDIIHIISHQSLSLLTDDQPRFWEGMPGCSTWRLPTQSTPRPIHNFRGRSLIVLPHQPIAENYFLLGLHWTLRIQPTQKLSNGTIFYSCWHGYAQTRICTAIGIQKVVFSWSHWNVVPTITHQHLCVQRGFCFQIHKFITAHGSLTLGNSAFCALGPYTRVSACIQKAVTNVCSGMLLKPCIRVWHFLRMKTILHPCIRSTKNTFPFLVRLAHLTILFASASFFLASMKPHVSPLAPKEILSKRAVHGPSDGSCPLSQSSSVMVIGERGDGCTSSHRVAHLIIGLTLA